MFTFIPFFSFFFRVVDYFAITALSYAPSTPTTHKLALTVGLPNDNIDNNVADYFGSQRWTTSAADSLCCGYPVARLPLNIFVETAR